MRNRRRGIDPGKLGNGLMVVGWLALLFVFWLLWLNEASAQGRMVFLESERDLGNGFKLCVYTEGVTITVASYKLCPISIEV